MPTRPLRGVLASVYDSLSQHIACLVPATAGHSRNGILPDRSHRYPPLWTTPTAARWYCWDTLHPHAGRCTKLLPSGLAEICLSHEIEMSLLTSRPAVVVTSPVCARCFKSTPCPLASTSTVRGMEPPLLRVLHASNASGVARDRRGHRVVSDGVPSS